MRKANWQREFLGGIAWAAMLVICSGVRQAQARDLIEITTPHFTVVSALNEKDTRELIDNMYVFQTVVASFTTVKDFRPQVPLDIYLVGSYEWDNVRLGKGNAGFMMPQQLSFVAALNAQGWYGASSTLYHEYVHFILRNADAHSYPQWFDEGLAELLSTVKITSSKVVIGASPYARLRDLAGIGESRWVPLKQVLTAMPDPAKDEGATHGDRLGFYTIAWALSHYLIFELPGGTKLLGKYLTLVEKGAPIEDAFEQAFGMSITDMEVILKRYVERDAFRNVSADRKKLMIPAQGAYQVRQLSAVESILATGTLMMRIGANRDLVPAYYDRALKIEPRNALALAGKANAHALAEQFDSADQLISQALAIAPTMPEVLVIAGDIELIRGAKLPATGDALADSDTRTRQRRKVFEYYAKALTVPYRGPEALETVARFANLALEFQTNTDMALMQVDHMRKMYGTEPYVAGIHGRLLMAAQRPKEARAAWQVAARYGTGKLRDAAIEAIKSIDAAGR